MGILSITFSILVPIVFWLLIKLLWKPKTRISYAFKFSIWPAIILSSQLGGPIARELTGFNSRHLMDITSTLMGISLISLLTAPIFFAIGYWVSRNKIKN